MFYLHVITALYSARLFGCSCTECYSTPGQCLIPIGYDLSKIPNTPHYTDYKTWAEGDTVLGWGGAEQGQSIASNGRAAGGTPAVWTTNDQSNTAAYHPLNKYRCFLSYKMTKTKISVS